MRTARCLEVLAETRARVSVPLILMTYSSIFDAHGWELLESEARSAGATSFIVVACAMRSAPPRLLKAAQFSTTGGAPCKSARPRRVSACRPRRRRQPW